jgi:YVTN family beta-propeller protein
VSLNRYKNILLRISAIILTLFAVESCARKDAANAPSEFEIDSVAFQTIHVSGYPDFLVDTIQKLTLQGSKPFFSAFAPGICGAPIVAFGSLWAASCSENNVLRIDRNSGAIIARIQSGVSDPHGEISLAAGDGSIWILSDKNGILSRIDPASNQVSATIPVLPNSFCAAFGFDAVWVTNTDDGSVQRIDPLTNKVTATIKVGPIPHFLAAGEGGVWTLNQGDGSVSRIDPDSNQTTATIDCQSPGTGGDIDAGSGKVWVRSKKGRMLQSIDPISNSVDRTYGPLNGSGAVRVAGAYVWVTAHDVNKVWVIR